MIPEETINAVVAAADIVSVVRGYVTLKRSGKDWRGNCPLHGEKTPSFYVNPVKQQFHCFGCKAGGGVIKFLMAMEHLGFADAVKRLGERFGVAVEEVELDPTAKAEIRKRAQLLALHHEVREWFHQLLLKHTAAAPARDYWKGRGLNGDNARNWKIGYAPPSAPAVMEWAQQKKFEPSLLVAGGLISLGENSYRREPWFRFSGRLMFPICNDQGECIGFSGRVLETDAKTAKYLNSPETPIFDKGKIFFGLDKSKRAILKAQKAIICEGQMDLISCYERGVENLVAPLGTAFTEHHARLLKRLESEVILCFDSDLAGRKAADRAFRELSQHGVYVRMAELPPGEDPDSLIKSQGVEALRERIDGAKLFLDFKVQSVASTTRLDDTRDKLRAASELAETIAGISGKVAQEDALLSAATQLALPAEEMRRMISRAQKQLARDEARAAAPQRGASPRGGTGGPAPEAQASRRHGGDGGPPGEPSPSNQWQQLPNALQEPYEKAFRVLCFLCVTDLPSLQWLRQQSREHLEKELPHADLLWKMLRESTDFTLPGMLDLFLSRIHETEAQHLGLALAGQVANTPTYAPGLGVSSAKGAWLALELVALKHRRGELQAHLKRPGLTPIQSMSLLQQRDTVAKDIVRLEAEWRQADTYLEHLQRLEDAKTAEATAQELPPAPLLDLAALPAMSPQDRVAEVGY